MSAEGRAWQETHRQLIKSNEHLLAQLQAKLRPARGPRALPELPGAPHELPMSSPELP